MGDQVVIESTWATLSDFPDRVLLGEDVIWSDDGEGGFLSSHRILSTDTHTGDGAFGIATDTPLVFRTIADCAARENAIYDEWLVRDVGAMVRQLVHQAPWLVAFPDRQVQDLDALFAEGAYTGAPGWAGVIATHSGPYLDQPATGNRIEFNGLDWWKREGEEYVENWVFVDMVHLFAQFGVDLLARLDG